MLGVFDPGGTFIVVTAETVDFALLADLGVDFLFFTFCFLILPSIFDLKPSIHRQTR